MARRPALLLPFLCAAALISLCHGAPITSADRRLLQDPGQGNASAPICPDGYTLLWQDEFDGPGSSVDPTWWTALEGDGAQYGIESWGNSELQYYSGRPANLYVQDGRLVIQAQRESGEALEAIVASCLEDCRTRCAPDASPDCVPSCASPRCDRVRQRAVTSARISTYGKLAVSPSEDFSSVHIEAAIRLPRGAGLWGAFWLLPEQGASEKYMGAGQYGGWPASGEIDIMEGTNGMENLLGNVYFGGEGATQMRPGFSGPAAAEGYQRFAVEWSHGALSWQVDGREFHRVEAAARVPPGGDGWFSAGAPGGDAPFDVPFYLILNLAVGGTLPQTEEAAALATLDAGAKQMEVDYVRICGKPSGQPAVL
jgi:hypothetical protein